jgi:hypothetical protein
VPKGEEVLSRWSKYGACILALILERASVEPWSYKGTVNNGHEIRETQLQTAKCPLNGVELCHG